MGDMKDINATRQATVVQAGERLKEAGAINEAQLAELKNDNVGPQDMAIGVQAMNKALDMLGKPGASAMLKDANLVKAEVGKLQLAATRESGAAAAAIKESGTMDFEATQRAMQILQQSTSGLSNILKEAGPSKIQRIGQ